MKVIGTLTVAKIGTGTVDDPTRPDTDELWWSIIGDTETTFTIAIYAEG